ncbi:MAG: hypothetical protein KDC76_08110 [Bacteroidetes bacterium]|nr:hypothetical protein [Bacteroidota bacterium]
MCASFAPHTGSMIITGEHISSVVRYEENNIDHQHNLNPFFNEIDQYIAGKKDKLVITHIGDSHIQADFLTHETRQLFQRTFGNGGRGFVFPYRALRTNGPLNVNLDYGGEWQSCRSAILSNDCNFGICGMTATTFDSSAFLRIDPNSFGEMNYEFDRLKLFHFQSAHSFDPVFLESDSSLKSCDILPVSSSVSEVYFGEMQDSLWIAFRNQSPQHYFQLFGMSLENEHRGLVYNAIGQNGAFVNSYLRSTFFGEQLAALNADLVIVSLGTNDGYKSEGMFCKACFKEKYGELIKRIETANPNAAILLTTPGDFYVRQRYHNKNIEEIRQAILELAVEHSTGVWDFNDVMGGDHAIKKWRAEGLAQRDLVHYTEKGYTLQGRLLYEAIMQAYESRFD